ncbi:hypothetical protein BS47DRAFT_1354922 [Hydnum rufescens UP504]|uniref:Uncharacterized protein n=1 Tax=Hydnum rufescens UP504 TaxID=1448309 RepID=A0A9P6AG21_9AGAM|nr:hypothetical protein BS47DRAFT_1354922 [Hydnum rufescens UP504]
MRLEAEPRDFGKFGYGKHRGMGFWSSGLESVGRGHVAISLQTHLNTPESSTCFTHETL